MARPVSKDTRTCVRHWHICATNAVPWPCAGGGASYFERSTGNQGMNPVVPLVLGLSAPMQKKVKMKTSAAPAPRVERQGRARFASKPQKGKEAGAEATASPANDTGGNPPDEPEDAAAGDAVAELEAVIGHTDDEEPAEKREAEEPSNFLAMYFKDMARLAVLRPQEEFESARKLESLEVALWARVLSY